MTEGFQGPWVVPLLCSSAHERRGRCRRGVKAPRKQTVPAKGTLGVVEGAAERYRLTARRLKGRAGVLGESRRRGSENEVWKHFSRGKRSREKADNVMMVNHLVRIKAVLNVLTRRSRVGVGGTTSRLLWSASTTLLPPRKERVPPEEA